VPSLAIRAVLLAALASALVACGPDTTAPKHATYHGIRVENLPKHAFANLGWVESAPGTMLLRVSRLEIWPHGWKAWVSFTNISNQNILLPKGGPASPIDFGLGVFTGINSPRLEDPGNYLIYADTITPKLPRLLKPGQRWSGTWESATPPRAKRILRLVFGVFFWQGRPPAGRAPFFLPVTQHAERAPPPIGKAGAAALTTTTTTTTG